MGTRGRVYDAAVKKLLVSGGIILHLPISIGPPWVLKVGGLTGGDVVRGTTILILVKNVFNYFGLL